MMQLAFSFFRAILTLSGAIFLLLASSSGLAGQDLFLDDLKNNRWVFDRRVDTPVKSYLDRQEIGLGKLKASVDVLRIRASIWTFTDREISIVNYDPATGLESDTLKYGYSINKDKMRLRIIHAFDDSSFAEFSVSMISTGSYISLRRMK
jgi:hypothetical protein